jgi:hypothetical protein
MDAGDIVLVRGSLADVLTALDLSRTVFRRIQANLIWAMGYNTLGIPIAAGVLWPLTHTGLPPQAAALAMAMSSVCVVLSSLALNMYSAPGAPSKWACARPSCCKPRSNQELHAAKGTGILRSTSAEGSSATFASLDEELLGGAEEEQEGPHAHDSLFENVCSCRCETCRSNKHFTATGSSLKLPVGVEEGFTGVKRESCGCSTCQCGE